jgi:hypothetical protein
VGDRQGCGRHGPHHWVQAGSLAQQEALATPRPGRARPAPRCTYKHLDGDRDSAVERRVASIFGHDCQVYQPIGDLFIIQGAAHTDH